MPLPRPCLPFSSHLAAEEHDSSSAGDGSGKRNPPTPAPAEGPSHSIILSAPFDISSFSDPRTASSSSSSSSTAVASDDAPSFRTIPSLPSLHSLLPASSATFLRLASFRFAGTVSVAVSPASLLLYAASESSISVYDLLTLRLIESFPAAPGAGAVKSVAVSSEGVKLFTAHQDGRIRAWKRSKRTGRHRLIAALPTVADRLRRLPLPSNYVAVRRHRKRLWIEHADAVSALAVADDRLYSVSWDKTLKIWRTSDLRCLESVAAHDDAVNAVAVGPDGAVYTGSADRRIRVWGRAPPPDRRHGAVATLERHRSAVNAVAITADGSVLYSGSCDRSILVWEKEESASHVSTTGALRGHERAVLSLTIAGDLLFSGSSDHTVRIWRREGREYACLGVMEGHASGVRSLAAVRVAAEADRRCGSEEEEYRVCSGSLDGEVRVWRVRVARLKRPDPS